MADTSSLPSKRQCAKCGSLSLNIKYSFTDEVLNCFCTECEYRWEEVPEDKKKDIAEAAKKLLATEGN